tara:strand:+ start:587 stop:1105 length:519 start_codon:yes stop_codon:yes gene_type:complete
MDSFIKSLKSCAERDFPINEVSALILNSQFSNKLLNKYSHFNKKIYTRNMIYKDSTFEVLLICWSAGQMAPIHGHEGEKCWFKILSGSLDIYNYELETLKPLKLKKLGKITASSGYLDGPADIHSINNCYKNPVITLHIYAKPYDSCDIYDLKTNQIKRLKMNYYSIDGKIC